ncbi:hypothetical protein F3K40_32350 [Streptomyces sp. LBUM 1478]|nr:hypothetical protein [Streptomyces sp. LBUM 1478]
MVLSPVLAPPMRVPAGALTGLIGVLLGASAISGVVASGRWQQNVSSGTPPELEDVHGETPLRFRQHI